MEMGSINWLAVVVAAVSSFALGALWYSPVLFSSVWQKEVGLSDDDIKSANMGAIFGIAFVLEFIMAANLAMFLSGETTTVSWGIAAGGLAGVWVFCGIAVAYLFAQKSWKLISIDGIYQVLALMIMGGIIGLWR